MLAPWLLLLPQLCAVLCACHLSHSLMYGSGGGHITSRIATEMHAFWGALEWVANSMLFVWVGAALGLVLSPGECRTSCAACNTTILGMRGREAAVHVCMQLELHLLNCTYATSTTCCLTMLPHHAATPCHDMQGLYMTQWCMWEI